MRVTANQVTAVRLLAMPFMASLVYGGERTRVVGVILGTLIGLTDFLDGYLARKHGPTVLGSLLDPVADKVFIVVCYAPYADRGGIPWWVAAAIICRELLVTVLRSSLELRGRRLPSTAIAKLKTWVQMMGFAFLVLLPIIEPSGGPSTGKGLSLLFGIPLVLAVVVGLIGRLVLGARWIPVWIAAGSLAALVGAAEWGGTAAAQPLLLAIVVGITWISAADYLSVGFKELASAETYRAQHWLRLCAGAALPVVALAAMATDQVPSPAVFVLLACEMARGAMDNFVAHNRIADFSWAGSLWVETLLLLAALLAPGAGFGLAIAAAAVAVFELARGLLKHRRSGLRLA